MMHRLLVYCGDYGIPLDGTKGASVHLRSLVSAFTACGVDVVVASPRAGASHIPGATVLPLADAPRPSDAAFDPVRMSEDHAGHLLAYARANRIDALYERLSLWTTAGVITARALGIPHLVEANAPLTVEAARWRTLRHADHARAAEREIARSATRIVCVSDPVAAYMRDCGAPAQNVAVEPNAVEDTFIAAGRARLAGPHAQRDPFTTCFVGSLKPWHGVETLLAAHSALGGAAAGYRLVIAGDGPLAPLVADAQRATAGVEYAGAMPHESIPALLARADVAAAPYRDDAGGYFSPLKVVEYQAAGVPVVASGGPGVEELVRDGVTGSLVPSGDAEALARAIATYRHDRARARACAIRAFQAVEHRTWRAIAERVLENAALAPVRAERA